LGPLFQLIFFIIAYSIFAIIAGAVLYLLFRFTAYIWKGNITAAKQGFWLPLKLGPYFLLALIVTIFVCEKVRDVTPPLTDYWSFQLDSSTSIGAIDTLDNWTIWPSPDGGEGIVSNVKFFDFDQNRVYGITIDNIFFEYRMGSERKLINLSEEHFDTLLAKNGLTRSNLKTPTVNDNLQ